MNRSVDGDVVVVEIFPKSEWKAPGSEVLDQDRKLDVAREPMTQLRIQSP